ncbi:uncharacterized protein LOC127247401 [Andrographis paniculata]|uniref:uncharacterized protein LOC127247401 n=1 Tax=Andrographis paniculata TaxID=175694 RepID=UPI0021E9A584|nr:uncharacterized protein LOC127247401 [Andrographis paniculata]
MASSSSYQSILNEIPDDIAKIILEKLWTFDRIFLRTVSKAWNAALRQLHGARPASELPWKILSKSFDQGINPKEIKLLSPSKKVYSFKYPSNGQCCCGSSQGWLFIGGGGDSVEQIANVLLWNPLSGEVRNLPSLSSLQFFADFVNNGLGFGLRFLSSFVTRVHVFSTTSGELAAAMIVGCLVLPSYWRVIICTPDDPQWTVVDLEVSDGNPMDVLFHRGKLIVYCTKWTLSDSDEVIGHGCRTVNLINGGEVEVEVVTMVYGRSRSYSPNREVSRDDCLVAATAASGEISGEILVVSVTMDWHASRNERFPSSTWLQIGGFEVQRIDIGGGSPEKLRSIGRQALFVGGGCDAVSTAVDDIDGGDFSNDSVYFEVNGFWKIWYGENHILEENYRVHQRVRFNLRNNVVSVDAISYDRTNSKLVGWFMPKI